MPPVLHGLSRGDHPGREGAWHPLQWSWARTRASLVPQTAQIPWAARWPWASSMGSAAKDLISLHRTQ